MTTPGGGAANLGTVTGKVRISYESSNVRGAVKDIQNVQNALGEVGSSATASAKEVDRAGGAFTQFGRMIDRLGQKVVPNPAAGLGTRVENETARATKALSSLERSASRTTLNISPRVKITPSRIDLDRKIFDNALRGQGLGTLTISGSVRISPTEVLLDQGAITKVLQNKTIDPVTLHVPINLVPTQINTSQIAGALGGRGGGGGLSGLGGAGLAGMAAKSLGGITLGATAATVAVAGLGLALTKGFSRLSSIDNATVKLSAMGLKLNQIKAISTSALDAVQGTAFGLEEAFNTAADAINAGIKPGKDLDTYLKATTNTAALAGVGMQELGVAFARAAVQGKLTGEVAMMLYDRQVPLLKLLAEEYGVTQQKAQEMISNSQVKFDRFISAMSKTGGAAKAMGNTITGSFKNLGASISRLGANLLAPLFAKSKPEDANLIASAIQQVTKAIDSLGKMVKSHGQGIVSFFEFLGKGAMVVAKGFVTAVGFITDAVVKITEVFGDAVGWIADFVAKVSGFLGADGIQKNVEEFADNMHNLGKGLRENRDFNMGKLNNAMDQGWAAVTRWADATRQAISGANGVGDAMETTAEKASTLKEVLDKLDIKAKDAESALMGSNEQYREFIKQVKEKGGTDALISTLDKVRSGFVNGGRQIKGFADAIGNLRDTTKSASERANDLLARLQDLGVLPKGDALKEYNETLEQMTSYMSDLIDLAGQTGDGLANLDGTLNLNSKNGRTILDQIEQIRSKMTELVVAGEAMPAEALARTQDAVMDLLVRQANLSPAMAEKVWQKYFQPDALQKTLEETDPEKLIKDLFANDPAKVQTELNLLTTTQDLLSQLLGPDGQLHIPTVADTPGSTGPGNGPSAIPPGPAPTSNVPSIVALPGEDPTKPLSKERRHQLGIPDDYPDVYPSAPSGTGASQPLPPGATVIPPLTNPGINGQTGNPWNIPSANTFNQANIERALAQNPDLAALLQPVVDKAKQQGGNFSVAFAEGIDQSASNVQDALLRLAQLAPDILGSSPAKYGPLSGKGWTYYRGKTFTNAWAEGITSEATKAQTAAEEVAAGAGGGLGNARPLADQLKGWLKDMQQLSDFGKHMLEIGTGLTDTFFNIAKYANQLSGGRLFPKTYTKDPNWKGRGSTLGPWNPTPNPSFTAGTNGNPSGGGSTWNWMGPGGAANNLAGYRASARPASREEGARAVIAAAQRRGLTRDQTIAALAVLGQESDYGMNPAAYAMQNQSGTVVGGAFQQDSSYNQYGDRMDINNAAAGFIDQFIKRGGLSNPNPYAAALNVQRPATIAGGGYDDKTGAYLKQQQGARATSLYDAIMGQGTPSTNPTSVQAGSTAFSYGLPSGTNIPYGGAGFPPWVAQLAAAFNLQASTYRGHQNTNRGETGYAANPLGLNRGIDWTGSVENMQAFADFVSKLPQAEQVIFSNPNTGVATESVAGQARPGYYSAVLGQHTGHVHTRQSVSLPLPGELPPAFANAPQTGNQPVPVSLTGPAASDLGTVADNTRSLPTLPDKLQLIFQNDPILLDAINNQGALTQDTVVPVLQHLDSAIADQSKLNTPESKAVVTGLSGYKSQLMSQFGMQEGPDMLDQAMQIASGVAGIANDFFGIIDQGIQSIQAVSNIAQMLQYGIRNTGDVNKIIDNVQEVVTLFQKGWQFASDVLGLAGTITGAAGSGDTSGGAQAAAAALGVAAGITGIVGQVIGYWNSIIDLVQEGYSIVTKIVGRGIQNWLGLSGATDIKYLLDEMSGQVLAYSSDNPQNKTVLNTLGRELYTGYSDRQGPVNYLTIYQGPGQDPRDTMNDAMFAIKSSGVGVFGYDF